MKNRMLNYGLCVLLICGIFVSEVWAADNPKIRNIIDTVSQERVAALLQTFESFQTRHLLSSHRENFGIKASAEWIHEKFTKANPRLNVYFDTFNLPKQGRRLTTDIELINVVAVLPGTATGENERIFLVNAHYDTVARSASGRFDDVDTLAPGVNDDASGVTALIETSRAFGELELEATVYFVAFAGEEMGLIGSTLMAQKMKTENKNIEGVITLDMIGNSEGGQGQIDNTRIRVFSAGPADSTSRQLARFTKKIGEDYFPAAEVDLIYRSDRFGRGGDHTPFVLEGYAGVRMMEANENYSRQHYAADTFENIDLEYCTRNIRLFVSVLGSLALGPAPPKITSERGRAMLGRGESGYDAALRWNPVNSTDLEGYYVYWRKTTAPLWEKKVYVGNTTEHTFSKVTIDEFVFGVSAVDSEGNESLISAYVMPPRRKSTYQTKK